MSRKAAIKRSTTETSVDLELELDGSGQAAISTGIPFFDHMVNQLCKHGLFNLSIKAQGDLEVDYHHTVEDVGLALGEALKEALGDKAGINRFGFALIPMGDVLAQVALDICSRPYLAYSVNLPRVKINDFDVELIEEFLRAFCSSSGITLHVSVIRGENLHHQVEAIFKALGRSLAEATRINLRLKGPPSTKGKL